MVERIRTRKILVVSSEDNLARMTGEAVDGSLEVVYASDQKEGLEKARQDIPDIIALGYINPPGTAFKLHRQLKEGWITKNIPLLLVDTNPQNPSKRVVTMEEGLQIEADEFISLADKDERAPATRLAEPIARLNERLQSRLRERVNTVREAILSPDVFCITWEQIPGRGAFEMQQEELIENARRAARRGKIHAVTVTDNPGGNPAISTEILCTEVRKLGIEPIVHLAFRDKNRNQCESLLYGLAALGVRNLLMLTGDYPSTGGFNGRSKPVFDLDSVHGLQLVEMMNRGMEHEVMQSRKTLAPTDFFAGAVISPFKQKESELMGQYYKLRKKIQAGAKFLITQVGYDARKYHELLQWLRLNDYLIPVLMNIYILPFGAGSRMSANQIPGCVVTDTLLAELNAEKNSGDKGRIARLDRAAKMYAIAKGMGYAGAHIGGHGATYEMVEYIIDKGEELTPNWQGLLSEFDYPQKNGFYFFDKDEKSGLNTNKPAKKTEKSTRPFLYTLSRLAHAILFNPNSIVFKVFRPVAKAIDSVPWLKSAFGVFEHLTKVVLFGCMNCGDCSLLDVAFLCPLSQCPKNQRNGPCGGSYEGHCEVYTDKECIWVRAYKRLKGHKGENSVGEYVIPPCNWELIETPSWLNFYMGRDHAAKRLGIEPPEDKSSPQGK